ncbi:hypothetical protein K1719_045945 [Acacia pycnantha]|nr:hypothetical protein K1719_045945 [Acacia pycnantha]
MVSVQFNSYHLKGGCGDLPIQQALFHIEKVPENLEEISLTEKDAMRILNGNYDKKLFQRIEILHLQYFQETSIKFLNDLIQKFPVTNTLQARCSYFKTLFPSKEIGHCSIQSPPQIKTLWLSLLEKLEHIWNDNSALDTFVTNLEHLAVIECCRLIRLAPPLTSFTNLITLEVEDCNGMMDFMSPFTAKILIHLTTMTVRNCRMLEEVMMNIGKQDSQKNEASSGTERPLAQVTQNAYIPSTNQDTELIGLAMGTQEMGENIEGSSVEVAKVTRVYDGEANETIEKPLIQIAQEAQRPATEQDIEESRDLHIETQKICDTINRPPIPTNQNVPNSNMIHEAAPEPIDSSMQKLNIYKNYKGMIDVPEQNMPYLEVGVNQHPQVLGWLNTKQRRVFTSSFFSLFSDVIRILRTTRKVDLTEDDRNYIRECCTALEGVGFDESWINYVHGCIEECGDGEDLKRKVEEVEGQASNLKDQIESMKKELASVEESLVWLRDKTSKLHDFIDS